MNSRPVVLDDACQSSAMDLSMFIDEADQRRNVPGRGRRSSLVAWETTLEDVLEDEDEEDEEQESVMEGTVLEAGGEERDEEEEDETTMEEEEKVVFYRKYTGEQELEVTAPPTGTKSHYTTLMYVKLSLKKCLCASSRTERRRCVWSWRLGSGRKSVLSSWTFSIRWRKTTGNGPDQQVAEKPN